MKLAKLKHFIADVIEPKKKAGPLSIIYNILMSIIILASCVFAIIDIVVDETSFLDYLAHIVEQVSVIIFAVEYLLKFFAAEAIYENQSWFKSKISYVTSFESVIDIVCILSILLNNIPAELSVLRLLKLIKLARLVKLKDAIDEMREQGDGTEPKEEKTGIRKRVFEIIYKDTKGDKLSKAYDIFSIIIILLSVVIVVLDTLNFPEDVKRVIFIVEVVFTCFFALEYILRIWTADFEYPNLDKSHARTRYIFSFLAIIDLLSILPVFFTFSPDVEASMPTAISILKIFKIFRIARLLKMSRYLNGINNFVLAIRHKKVQILFSIVVLSLLLILCSVLLYSFESASPNNEFDNGFSGIVYFAKILSGVSGDAEIEMLQTIGGRVMVAIMIICGGCIIGVPIGIISNEFESMVKYAANEVDDEDDLFEEFSKKLTTEQKLKIIAEYHDKIEKEEEK